MTERGTLPPESFRIRPWSGAEDYYVVHVAPTLVEMRQTMVTHTGWCHVDQLACCISVRPVGEHALADHAALVGLLFFSMEAMGSGIVAHELAHAAFRSMERAGQQVAHWQRPDGDLSTDPTEEEYCNVVERLTREFWTEAYAHGIV